MAIFTIIGAIIGAGFASGQEIYLFFFKYGVYGIYGLIICSLLIGYVIYKVLNIVYAKDINTYVSFLQAIFPNKLNKKKYLNLSYINNIIVNMFLLFTFFIMISGFGAYFKQELGLSNILGAIILASTTFLVFMTDIKGLTKINSMMVPILIGFVMLLGIRNMYNTDFSDIKLKNIFGFGWIRQSIIYASYNIILLIPVLVNLKKYIKSKKQILVTSILCMLIFFFLAISIFFMLINVDISFDRLEMPIIYVVTNKFNKFKTAYGIVILISIFTTAASIGISFLENICKTKKAFLKIAIIMCITGIIFSNFGFSNLVKILFPVFGYLGLLQIILISFK